MKEDIKSFIAVQNTGRFKLRYMKNNAHMKNV